MVCPSAQGTEVSKNTLFPKGAPRWCPVKQPANSSSTGRGLGWPCDELPEVLPLITVPSLAGGWPGIRSWGVTSNGSSEVDACSIQAKSCQWSCFPHAVDPAAHSSFLVLQSYCSHPRPPMLCSNLMTVCKCATIGATNSGLQLDITATYSVKHRIQDMISATLRLCGTWLTVPPPVPILISPMPAPFCLMARIPPFQ